MIVVLQRMALGGYLVATCSAFLSIFLRRQRLIRLAGPLAGMGLLCHSLAFVFHLRTAGPALFTTLDESLSFLSLVAVFLYLFGSLRYRLHVLGVIMLPLALILGLLGSDLTVQAVPVSPALRDPLLWLHVVVSSLGVGSFFLTFTFSVIYLIQERALKEKRPARFFLSLPSLTACDQGLFLSLMVGFVLLTAGLILAMIWSASFRGTFHVWQNQREILALISWGIFGVVLYARLVRGWRGRKTALLAIVGFAAVMLRLIGGHVLS
ncbi:MAG: inner membrane protein YpjD [Acidobacteriota bacterium]